MSTNVQQWVYEQVPCGEFAVWKSHSRQQLPSRIAKLVQKQHWLGERSLLAAIPPAHHHRIVVCQANMILRQLETIVNQVLMKAPSNAMVVQTRLYML